MREATPAAADRKPWPANGGIPWGGDDLPAGGIRAALLAIQKGTCATCPATFPLEWDHDHETGLIRGLLCKSCNTSEGKTRSGRFDAYRADPPAGKRWLHALPDDWSRDDDAAVRQLGITIFDYVLTVWPDRLATRRAAIEAERIAFAQQRQWTEPGR